MLRKNTTAAAVGPKIIVVLVIITIVGVGAVYAISARTDPGRLMNNVEKPVAYFRAVGEYEVGMFLEAAKGKFRTGNVDETAGPPSVALTINPLLFGFIEAKGFAFVRISVSGAGISVINWESEHTEMHFSSIDVLTNAVYIGTFTSGTAAFPVHGDTVWTFTLVWQETLSGNEKVETIITSITRTVSV